MRSLIGVSIIDEPSVDLIHYICSRMQQNQQQQHTDGTDGGTQPNSGSPFSVVLPAATTATSVPLLSGLVPLPPPPAPTQHLSSDKFNRNGGRIQHPHQNQHQHQHHQPPASSGQQSQSDQDAMAAATAFILAALSNTSLSALNNASS